MLSLTWRQTLALILIFTFTSIVLIVLDQNQRLDTAKGSAGSALQPFTTLFDRFGDRLSAIGQNSDGELERELAQVTAERDRLLAENARLKQLEEEVDQLHRQLGFRETRPELTVVSANVVGRDPSGIRQMIVIDRGSNDGVQQGMAVISPDFFVGQVTEVDPDRARITLAIDATSQIGAEIQRSGAEGVAHGRWQAGGRIELRYLDSSADVVEGDVVVTSGRTIGVPRGLVIGQVYRTHQNVQADSLTAEVMPLYDVNDLHAVTVILKDNSAEDRSE